MVVVEGAYQWLEMEVYNPPWEPAQRERLVKRTRSVWMQMQIVEEVSETAMFVAIDRSLGR
jgi:hypothetical protein